MSGEAVKTIGFMPRRPDIDRAAFRNYYETRHAPLAAPLFPFRRYRRNHLTDAAIEPGFDCIAEFWIGSLDELGSVMAGEAGDTMRADEPNFMDQPRIFPVRADPVATGSDTGRTMALLRRDGGDPDTLARTARQAGAGLDLLAPFGAQPAPFDAILRCEGEPPPLPAGWTAALTVTVEAHETDPATLRG
ncbi:EthD domain-containing protein [Rhizorhabdus wittichii]|uniref:EthD domain-containing protein n=1 Tax=Rhizorhabdus wittichii TaxID=160791 RepID=UPI0002F99DD1|nr:EthD domain-containing protein [Rhizorhabdus wittichii]